MPFLSVNFNIYVWNKARYDTLKKLESRYHHTSSTGVVLANFDVYKKRTFDGLKLKHVIVFSNFSQKKLYFSKSQFYSDLS